MVRRIYIVKSSRRSELFLVEDFPVHCYLSLFLGLGCKTKCAAPFSFCVKHKGNEEKCECIQECPYFLKQVCGSDDVTYDNECLLKKKACEKNREITIKKNGTCTGNFSHSISLLVKYLAC